MKNLLGLVLGVLWITLSSFQGETVEMADGLRSNGLIYVLVLIIVIILAGLFIYLFSLDRKISKIENEHRKPEKE